MWASVLDWDYRGSAEMILRYVDAKILPGYGAVERGLLFGYAFFVYEGSKGVIGDLFVEKANGLRSQTANYAVEQRLLQHVIDTLQGSPGVTRIEAQLLVHEAGAVAKPFTEHGFRRYPRLFMCLPLRAKGRMGQQVELSTDIELRRWHESMYQEVASVITLSYRAHVDSEINDQYRTLAGCLRFLNNIVRFPGCGTFDPTTSFVAVHRPTKSIVGIILCSRVKDDVGHVTQVCVVPEFRGKRIGEALLRASATELRKSAFDALTLTVTEANRGAVELYKRLGFEVRRVFDAFVWEG